VPELPEVEYERRRLQRAMAGSRIRGVILRRPNLRYEFPSDFVRRLEGQTVRGVARRAKYLLAELGSGDMLLMHLGMSGSFRVVHRNTRAQRLQEDRYDLHDHVVFEISTGTRVVFNDPRRFGFMTLLAPDELDTHATLGRLGPEPLAARFDVSALARELRHRKTTLKIALLDQRVIAGLGNIYVCEALHRARLSPLRRASTLAMRAGEPRPALDLLVKAIREVLKEAIRNQYPTPVASAFRRKDRFRVYDREGRRCLRRGCTGTIKRIVQGGRSTFYCPVCQH
jgi:formamidopyrimidine-DNA glycosylase